MKFDSSLGIEDTWIDSDTMNFFNAQRDNIYVSSSKYDVVQLRALKTQFYSSNQAKVEKKELQQKKK